MAQRGNRPKDPADTKGIEKRKEPGVPEEVSGRFKTKIVPGPGPNDRSAGRATKKHLKAHGLE